MTSDKLADNAVTTTKITDGSVTLNKLAAGVIPDTYTKNESDKRFANAIVETKTDTVVTNPNVLINGPFVGCSVLGETKEVGTGDKSPTNPYTFVSSQPTKVTSCGKNLINVADYSKDIANNWFVQTPANYRLKLNYNYTFKYNATSTVPNFYGSAGAGDTIQYLKDITSNVSPSSDGSITIPFTATESNLSRGDYFWFRPVRYNTQQTFSATAKNIQLEIGAATTYEPYNGNTYTLPTGLTLNAVGDVKDEYDVLSGKLTQRVGKIVINGSDVKVTNISSAVSYTHLDVYKRQALCYSVQ